MQQHTIQKTENLLMLESSVAGDIPLNQSLNHCLVAILGDRYSEPIQSLLKNTSKLDLIHLTIDQIKQNGFTTLAAKKVLGAIQFGLTLQKLPAEKRQTIQSVEDAADMLSYLANETQEHLVALFLNTKNQVIGRKTIFIGSLNCTVIHPREIILEALKLSSASFLVGHNHVSGNPTPSIQDIEVTRKLKEASQIVGVDLIDHIIIGDGCHLSLSDKGYI